MKTQPAQKRKFEIFFKIVLETIYYLKNID
jgi:hypothetical protein